MTPLKRPMLFVSGKGGVGKTTVATSLAFQLAASGRQTLLALTDETAAPGLFETAKFGGKLAHCATNLWVARIEPEAALLEYASLVTGSGFAAHSLLGNRYARGFLSAVPGLYQWAVLGKAWSHATGQQGARKFDSVVLDAPATGHGLEMLRVPKAITEVAAPGVLRRDAELAWKDLRDPKCTGIILVTLPEELPVTETTELLSASADLEVPVAGVVLNGITAPIFSEPQRSLLLKRASTGLEGAPHVIEVGRSRANKELEETLQQARLRSAWGGPLAELPWVVAAGTPQRYVEFGDEIARQFCAQSVRGTG